MKEIVDKIIERIESKKGNKILFHEQNLAIEIKKENFHSLQEVKSNKKLLFMDGGNAELIKAGSFSLQFVRVYYTIYQDNKRIKTGKREFYALIDADAEEKDLVYNTELFQLKGDLPEKIKVSSLDKNLMQGNNRVSPSQVANMLRRFAEIETCIEIIDEADIIVMDGELQARFTGEKEKLNKLFEKAQQKNKIIAAIAKTSELFTDKGGNALSLVHELAPQGMWYYQATPDILIAKLDPNTSHIFKLETYGNAGEVLGLLAWNSKDPVFKGYPYGLIEADRFARVSNNERDYFLTMLMSKAGKKWNIIKKHINSVNAHDILDNIS